MKMADVDLFPIVVGSILALCVALLVVLVWCQGSIEARTFNRCHPGSDVTTWEAIWADFRIMDCEPK